MSRRRVCALCGRTPERHDPPETRLYDFAGYLRALDVGGQWAAVGCVNRRSTRDRRRAEREGRRFIYTGEKR